MRYEGDIVSFLISIRKGETLKYIGEKPVVLDKKIY